MSIPTHQNVIDWVADCLTRSRLTEVASAPELTIIPANSSVSLTGNYTLIMADADVVGTNESTGQTRHWLVNGVVLKAGTPTPPAGDFFFLSHYLLTC